VPGSNVLDVENERVKPAQRLRSRSHTAAVQAEDGYPGPGILGVGNGLAVLELAVDTVLGREDGAYSVTFGQHEVHVLPGDRCRARCGWL
jgi:hypothetical protein